MFASVRRRELSGISTVLLAALLSALLLAPACAGSGPAPTISDPPPPTSRGSAACAPAQQMPDQGNAHIQDLGHAYSQHPATSGPHYPVPFPPQPDIFTAPVAEARALHNLEHGYVWAYYRPDGPDALPAGAVDALRTAVGGQRKVLMAPYRDLPAGASLALAAWDELQLCDSRVTAAEAVAALGSFVVAFREGTLAPEPLAF